LFETRLRDDAELRRRVDLWLAQNEAIRIAFGAPARPRGPLSLGRPGNDSMAPRSAAEIVSRRASPIDRSGLAPAQSRRVDAQAPAPRARFFAWPIRLAAVACLSALLLSVSNSGGPSDPRDPLMDAAISAYRAFGESASTPLDFATHDSAALGRWLAPRFVHAPLSGDLRIPGWRLLGARVVSGVGSAAALILFQNEAGGERAGLLIEPLDAPPDWAPASRNFGPIVLAARTQDSVGIAAVGRSVGIVAAVMRVWSEAAAPEY
jgi:anti-sigma factor RsiW